MPDPVALFERLGSAYLKYSRSDALAPLGRFGWLLFAMTSVAAMAGITWLLIVLAIFDAVLVLTFLAAYLYLLKHDRDSLRSERYNVQRMAIERGLVGDSAKGLQQVSGTQAPMIPDGGQDAQ